MWQKGKERGINYLNKVVCCAAGGFKRLLLTVILRRCKIYFCMIHLQQPADAGKTGVDGRVCIEYGSPLEWNLLLQLIFYKKGRASIKNGLHWRFACGTIINACKAENSQEYYKHYARVIDLSRKEVKA